MSVLPGLQTLVIPALLHKIHLHTIQNSAAGGGFAELQPQTLSKRRNESLSLNLSTRDLLITLLIVCRTLIDDMYNPCRLILVSV